MNNSNTINKFDHSAAMPPGYKITPVIKIGLKIDAQVGVKLPNKYGERLHTKNFRKVHSEALFNLDYDSKRKIVEIEYQTGKIYHYLDIEKKIWTTICSLIDQCKSLGTYINTEFKAVIENEDHGYYELLDRAQSHPGISQ